MKRRKLITKKGEYKKGKEKATKGGGKGGGKGKKAMKYKINERMQREETKSRRIQSVESVIKKRFRRRTNENWKKEEKNNRWRTTKKTANIR